MEGGGPVRDGDGVGNTAVGGELFFKGGGDRTLRDHAGGENGENGFVLLFIEGRLGDRDMHGFSNSGT
jgi:hypothetical protein